jgi:CarboxypepD_reg-like domain/Secretion system C-terminal sorting domain
MSHQASSFQLSIADPCHESWRNMTPIEQGRFCESCQKQVVDFTTMTDAEIFSYFQQSSGNTCGRFFNTQLQRDVAATKPGRVLRLKWWWAAFISGILFTAKAKAQRPATYGDTVVVTGYKVQKRITTMGMVASLPQTLQTLQGRVVDHKGEPMVGVSILMTGSIYTAVTDSVGKFNIDLPASITKAEIEVSFLGYNSKRQKIHWKNGLPNGGDMIEIVLGMDDMQMMKGEVVVVGYAIAKPKHPKLDWKLFKKNITPKEQILKVYPNPARGNEMVYLKELPAGNYSISLHSMLGVEISSSCIQVLNSSKAVSWQMPSANAGTYILKAQRQDNEKVYTSKIVLTGNR